MYMLRTKASFDSAHFLWGYEGKCRNIHGHRWTVEIEVYDNQLIENGQEKGMVVDFGSLKKDLKGIADNLDHCLIIEKGSLKPATLAALHDEDFRIVELDFRPTAENLARYIYDLMGAKGYQVYRCSVYETPNNVATFMVEAE